MCDRECGCPIEDLASDLTITAALNKYVSAKALFQSTGLASIQEETFRELGLLDDLGSLVKLETYWAHKLKREAKK